MSERAEPAACAVSPVGAVSRCRGRTSIHIAPPYRPALHLLGEFSHALVVFPAAGASAKRRDPAALVRVGVARIIRVDESSGVLEIDRIDAADRTPVWDVKPYFPIEDRVRDCITRGAAAKSPPWRPETSAAEIRKDTDRAGSSRSRPPRISSAPVSLSFAGIVRAGTGEFRLELPGLGAGAWKALGRSSHVRVVWWFDRFDKPAYRKTTQCNPPYENAPRTGVFASRSPVRPNPIGIDTARIVSADAKARVLTVVGMESMDRTPVLDVHPYLPWLDRVEHPVTPVWVRHWPQWKPEDAGAAAVSPDRIKVSDASRLSSLMPSGSRDTRRVISDSATNSPPIQTDSIQVTGARQNNLRGLSCDIPIRKITVITGVSGSGKSSLAFDTLYAESHRRFLDSVSTAGRQAFEQFERPDVENIGNLPPAVAIEQKSIGRNPRSTVGTMTEIYDYLRLLFARLGTRHCPDCGRAVEPLAPDDISRRLAALAPGTPFTIRPHETDGPEAAFVAPPQPSKAHARAVMSAVKAALDAGHGALCARVGDRDFLLHSRQCCFFCRRPFLTLMSSAFSYNHPAGMCPDCHGLCVRLTTDPGLIVTDPDKSVLDGASPWWADLRKHLKRPNANWMKTEVFALAASMGVDLELPWAQLPEEFRRCALFGTGDEAVQYRFTMSSGRRGVTRRPVAGAVANINRLFRETSSESTRDFYLRFMREQPCETCCGERLAPEGRLTTLAGRRYPEAAGMSVAGLRGWVDGLSESLDATRLEVGADILRELRRRLRSLASVGVDYLTLDRSAPTLSGGEAQRIRLAAQLGGGLTGLLYVLDEPSIGLHPHDHGRMLDYLRRLRDAGNTVVVVEHDADTMRAADRLIDIGPGAGENGGRLVAEGTPDEMIRNPASLTGRYLSGQLRVADPRPARRPPAGWLTLAGARLHTLRGVTARIPLGVITCVTGVSGSGKSSLIARTLHPALARALHHSGDAPGPFDRLEGIEQVDKVINITQSPIGRTPRSNPATYTGVFDDVREMFADSPAARERGWTAARFSFNSPEGRCESCAGAGRKRIEMHFMPDVWITCPACRGRRFNDETLEVRLDGLDIAAVLDLDIAGALRIFAGRPAARALQTLADVGLGYLRLGQSALTLSGGEAQRVKLAKELSRHGTGRTVYILDEPTTGLHFADIRDLIGVLSRITDAGNTVIVIEHNMDVISSADWVIDMGPEGGADGGEIVAEGTPEDVARSTAGHTGRFLARRLNA